MSRPLGPGDVLMGRYVLIEPLGVGLGGETWRADPNEGGPPVAVKIVASTGDTRSQRNLLNEAAILRELDHPHVLRYLGVVDLPGGATFLVTEFVEGGNLWSWRLQRTMCPPGVAAELLRQVAEALVVVHARGILHRDLKPQNVLVRPSGGPVPTLLVADFGISRRPSFESGVITRIAGTPGYAAPEVWTGAAATPACDVYGLGAIAWFLVTGLDPEPAMGSTHPDVATLPGLAGAPYAEGAGAALIDLIRDMLALRPDERPALREVVRRLGLLDAPAEEAPLAPVRSAVRTREVAVPPAVPPSPSVTVVPPEAPPVPAPTVTYASAAPEPSRPAGETPDRPGAADPSNQPSDFDPFDAPPAPPRSRSRVWLLGLVVALGVCAGGAFSLFEGVNALFSPEDVAVAPSMDGPGAGAGIPDAGNGTAEPVAAAPVGDEAPAVATAAPTGAAAGSGTEAGPARVAGAAGSRSADTQPEGTPDRGRTATSPRPESASTAPPVPAGPVHRLRVGIDAPNGLPADVSVRVLAPGGVLREAQSTQVVVPDTVSGAVTIEVRSTTRVLARQIVTIPSGEEVRVLCKAPAADFDGMRCAVRE